MQKSGFKPKGIYGEPSHPCSVITAEGLVPEGEPHRASPGLAVSAPVALRDPASRRGVDATVHRKLGVESGPTHCRFRQPPIGLGLVNR